MEFSNLQPVSLDGHLQERVVIESAADLSLVFNSQANAGEQVEMFFAIAETKPEVALTTFSTVVRNLTSPPIKALALQGFGKIPSPLKQALASCVSQESQELLKLLCSEVRGRNSDLTTWAAAEALKETGFAWENMQHSQGGNLTEPPRRVQNEVLDRKFREIRTIKRLNSRKQFTAEYERFLEFWVYGPTSELFNENSDAPSYFEVVKDVLNLTQLRGIQLGLNATNEKVQEEAFTQARVIFRQYGEAQVGEFKTKLGDSLKRFLKNTTSEDALSKLVSAINFELKINLKPSDREMAQSTVIEIQEKIDVLEQYVSQIFLIFSSAIEVSDEPTLSRLLKAEENAHINHVNSWIKVLTIQIERITDLSTSCQTNAKLVASILQSIRSYDEEFYRELQSGSSSTIGSLVSSTTATQEDCDEVNTQLSALKNQLSSALSRETSTLMTETNKLQTSIAENRKLAGEMLRNTAIWFVAGALAEVIVGFIIFFIVIVFLAGAGGG